MAQTNTRTTHIDSHPSDSPHVGGTYVAAHARTEPPHVKLLIDDARALYDFLHLHRDALEGETARAHISLSCRLAQHDRQRRSE